MRPFLHTTQLPALQFLNVGGSVFGGQTVSPYEPLPLRTSIQSSENDDAAKAASTIFLKYNDGVSMVGTRYGGAVHFAW